MNFKTTISAAVLLIALVAVYTFSRSIPKPTEGTTTTAATPAPRASAMTQDLIEKKLGDVVKVVCQVKGKEAWTFEKKAPADGGTAMWRMTTPIDAPVASWEADKFGRELGRLQYEVGYKPGESGAVSLADAGLSPPEATVTLTDAEGVGAAVEIGKPASDNETYVRLAGGDRVCVGKANLRSLIKHKPLEYRDTQLWNFAPENAARVEINDRPAGGEAVNYVFVRDGGKWMMQSPASAKASSKVDDMLRSLGRMRVSQWHDDDKEKLGVYGLESAPLTVRVTVEEKVAAKTQDEPSPDEEEGENKKEEAPPQIQTSVYELQVSDRTPIGEDGKVYVRVAGESAVVTATTEKLRPVLAEWRDMKITSANVESATRLELQVAGQRAALVQKEGEWSFEGDGGAAETSPVRELLRSIKDLSATVFVEADSPDAASFGFSQPMAEVRITVPGADTVERIAVGAYTDDKTKLLAYVRRNDSSSIGKVRSSDLEKLLRGPITYRDRTVFDLPSGGVQKLSLTLENRYVGGKNTLTFERKDDVWSMTGPTMAAVRADRMDVMVSAISDFKATAIASEGGDEGAYGLNAPKAAITLTHQAPDHEPADYLLAVAMKDGKCYVKRSDRATIFEVPESFFHTQLYAELRTPEVLSFDDAKVREFSIRKGEVTHAFAKGDGQWRYKAEPDLPLDGKKVDTLLSQLKDLKTERYVRSAAADLGPFGLSSPHYEAVITLEDGRRVLRVSQDTNEKQTEKGHYACTDDHRDVFLLPADVVKRLDVNLANLEKR